MSTITVKDGTTLAQEAKVTQLLSKDLQTFLAKKV